MTLRALLAASASLVALGAAAPAVAQGAEAPADPAAAPAPAAPEPAAAEVAQAVELPEVVIFSGARDLRALLDTPASADVVGPEEIADRMPQTYEDLLGDVPGVSIGGGPRGISQTPNIRGFDDDQIALRVDGARQTFSGGHRGRFFVDPQALKRVEVLRGGASTLYGSGAMGGVIALETKDAADYLDPGDAWGGEVGLGYNSQGDEVVAHGAGAVRAGAFDMMGFLSWRPMSSDLEDGRGETILDSQIDMRSGIAKLGFEPDAAHRFELSWQGYEDDGDTPPNANAASSADTVVDRDLKQHTGRLAWDFNPAGSALWDVSALAWVTHTELSEDRYDDDRLDETEQTTYGIEATNVSHLDIGLPLDLSYGFEVYRDDYSAERNGVSRPQAPDARLTFAALFAQGDLELGRDVTLTPGLRLDHYEVDPDETYDSRSETELSPRLALSWRPQAGLQLYASASQSFRAPQASELYNSGVHFAVPGFGLGPDTVFTGVNEFIPNPDLEPEKALQFEVGGRWETEDLRVIGDRLSFSASAYYADVDDFIDQTVTFMDYANGVFNPITGNFEVGGSTTTSNVDARLWGFEASARYDAHGWFAGAGLSIPRGRNRDGGALGSIPQDKLTLTAGLRPVPEVEIGARATLRAGQDDVPEGGDPTDGSGVVDLFATWTPTQGALEGARFAVGVDNVFDQPYRIAGNGLYQPGIAFKAAASLAF